jgi:hypothetical protein
MRKLLVPAVFAVALFGHCGAPVATQWRLRLHDFETDDVARLRIAMQPPLWVEATLENAGVVATAIRAPPR